MTERSTLARRLVAETIGTASLVLFGAGAVVAALTGGSLNPAEPIGPLLVTALWDWPAAWRDLLVIARSGAAPGAVAVGREQERQEKSPGVASDMA